MAFAFNGKKSSAGHDAVFWVNSYLQLQSLSKIGVNLPIDELDCFEVDIYTLIDQEFSRLELKAMKKK